MKFNPVEPGMSNKSELGEEDMSKFKHDLQDLINKHCIENASNTPDFILAQYLVNCLDTYNKVTHSRDIWWGHKTFEGIDAV